MNQSHTPNILICDPIHDDGINLLRQMGKVTVSNKKLSPVQLIDAAQNASAVVVRSRTRLTLGAAAEAIWRAAAILGLAALEDPNPHSS